MTIKIEIIQLNEKLAATIPQVAGGVAWNGGVEKWERYLREHLSGQRHALIAWREGRPVGYGSLIFQPHYRPFLAAGIPEISDLVVAEAERGQGIATTLIAALETASASAFLPIMAWRNACIAISAMCWTARALPLTTNQLCREGWCGSMTI
jgi:GNAT superfamily N-acetyltransferase